MALAALATALLLGCTSKPAVVAQIERLAPVKLVSLGPQLQESSGLALYDDRLWSMNDSEGAPELIWLDLPAGRLGSVKLEGATNFDWEALTLGDEQLYLLDCGNNRGDRIWMQLYAVPLSGLKQASVGVERSDFRWGDTQYQVARREHNNDCEAAAWVDGQIWLFTKNWQDQQSRLYKLTPGTDRQQLLTQKIMNVGGLVTGADYSAEHKMLVLLGYGSGLRLLQPFIWLAPVTGGELIWDQAKRYDLAESGQWEAIVWQGSELLLTREQSILGDAEVARLKLPKTALSH